MTLEKQDIDLAFAGGVDQKTDPKLSMRLQSIVNLRYAKSGTLTQRRGVTAIGAYNKRLDTSTPGAPELLAAHGSELLRIGTGQLDSYLSQSNSDWVSKGRVPECILRKDTVVAANLPNSSGRVTHSCCAYANGYIVHAYVFITGSISSSVYVDVINATTGARAMASKFIGGINSTVAITQVRAFADGNLLLVAFCDPNTSTIFQAHIDTTALVINPVVNTIVADAVASPAIGAFDVSRVSSGVYAYVYERLGGAGIYALTVNSLGGVVTAAVRISLHTGINGIAVKATTGEGIYVAHVYAAGGTSYCWARYLTTVLGTTWAESLVDSKVTALPPRSVFVERVTSTKCVVGWDLSTESAYWNEIDGSGAVYSPSRSLSRMAWMGNALVYGGRTYALAQNNHATHGTHFLVDLSVAESIASGAFARMVAVTLPRENSGVTGASSYLRLKPSAWAAISSTEFMVSVVTQPSTYAEMSVIGIRASFDTAWKRTLTSTSSTAIIPGGSPCIYDETEPSEIGFAYEPDINVYYTAAPVGAAGGPLDAAGTYGYKFTFEWTDALGNIQRSAPSATVSVVPGAGNGSVTLTLPHLDISNKNAASAPVRLGIYRTQKDSAGPYYLYSYIANGSAATDVDATSDATLATRPELYTTGNVLPNFIPPSASLCVVYKNAPILAGTDDDSIWVGKAFVEGEGPAFSQALLIAPFDGGRVIALSVLDEQLIVFKSDSIYIISGDPPDDLGNSSLSLPQRIQSDVGCIDPRTVAACPWGIVFQSRSGVCLLDRSLAVSPIGLRVEDTVNAAGTVLVSAVTVPDDSLVRVVTNVSSDTSSATLDMDYYHGQPTDPVWTSGYYPSPVAATGAAVAAPIRSACYWGGAFTFITAAGHTYQESRGASSQYYDSGGGRSYTPTLSWLTGHWKTALVGYHRVYKVGVLGTLGPAASGMAMTLSAYCDYASSPTEGTGAVSPTTGQTQFIHPMGRQKSTALQIGCVATAGLATVPMVFDGLSLRVGVKPGLARLGTSQKG